MKNIYKRIKVNKHLVKKENRSLSDRELEKYLQSETNDTLPKGKVTGVYFIPYYYEIDRGLPQFVEYESNIQTDITLKDSQGRLLTPTTDLRDYAHKGGGYNQGFKLLDFNSINERVTISWISQGSKPISGEFIFRIEIQQNEC